MTLAKGAPKISSTLWQEKSTKAQSKQYQTKFNQKYQKNVSILSEKVT